MFRELGRSEVYKDESMWNITIKAPRLFQIALGCIVLSIVWYAPAWMILRHAFIKPMAIESREGLTSSLFMEPPTWSVNGSEAYRLPILGWHSLRLSFATAALAIPTATFIALILCRCQWRSRPVFRLFWTSAIFLPLPVMAAAWLGAFGNLGRMQAFGMSDRPLISGWSAAALIHALSAIPLVVWVISGVMNQVDDSLESLARVDHPLPLAICHSTLKWCIPAAWSALLVVFILTAGDMTVTDLVQERTFAEEAYLQAQMGDGLTAAARTALAPTFLMTGLMITWASYHARRAEKRGSIPDRLTLDRLWIKGWQTRIAAMLITAIAFIGWGVPFMALVWRAGRSGGDATLNIRPEWSLIALGHNLRNAWPDLADSLPSTLMVASTIAITSTFLAWILAELSAISSLFKWAALTGAAIGLAVPGPVAGLAVQWLWTPYEAIYDSSAVIIAAQLFRLMPVTLILLWPSIFYRSRPIQDLVDMDGLSARVLFWRLEWPTKGPVAIAAMGVTFGLSVGELPATNLVVPPGVEMLSVRLWGLMHTGVESHLAAVVLLCMLAFCVMITFGRIIRHFLGIP